MDFYNQAQSHNQYKSVFSQHVDDLVTEKKEYNLIDGIFAVIGNQVIFHSDIENQVLQYKNQGVIDDNLKNNSIFYSF